MHLQDIPVISGLYRQRQRKSAGQTVFHFHMHIIPRYDGGPEMVTWKPGEASGEELEETAGKIRNEIE